uniref:Arrestin-like N-terminal domain-containing protein n=1 Tax=Megaselia scalaris TaxID=36166 RepID=T1GVS0_MEGSC
MLFLNFNITNKNLLYFSSLKFIVNFVKLFYCQPLEENTNVNTENMGLKGCEVRLDNPWNTYYAGQTINGEVALTFDKPKKVRSIIIRFLGEANTEWIRKQKDEEETEYLKEHEEYFQIQTYLLGCKNSSEIELPSGTHTYPFTCALPPTLPSSFEGEFGHVRYTVKVTLDRPWKFDQDMKMAFTVISPLDLNLNPAVKEPRKLEVEKSFCCFCCKSEVYKSQVKNIEIGISFDPLLIIHICKQYFLQNVENSGESSTVSETSGIPYFRKGAYCLWSKFVWNL